MISVKVGKAIKGYCDWCAKPASRALVPVTLITPRGTFLEAICDTCAEEFEARAE